MPHGNPYQRGVASTATITTGETRSRNGSEASCSPHGTVRLAFLWSALPSISITQRWAWIRPGLRLRMFFFALAREYQANDPLTNHPRLTHDIFCAIYIILSLPDLLFSSLPTHTRLAQDVFII